MKGDELWLPVSTATRASWFVGGGAAHDEPTTATGRGGSSPTTMVKRLVVGGSMTEGISGGANSAAAQTSATVPTVQDLRAAVVVLPLLDTTSRLDTATEKTSAQRVFHSGHFHPGATLIRVRRETVSKEQSLCCYKGMYNPKPI
jgi:hypothetical protein